MRGRWREERGSRHTKQVQHQLRRRRRGTTRRGKESKHGIREKHGEFGAYVEHGRVKNRVKCFRGKGKQSRQESDEQKEGWMKDCEMSC